MIFQYDNEINSKKNIAEAMLYNSSRQDTPRDSNLTINCGSEPAALRYSAFSSTVRSCWR